MTRRLLLLPLLLTIYAPATIANDDLPVERTMRATVAAVPPILDGRLDDPLWSHAEPASNFRQIQPEEGAPATESTQVMIGYDRENLYIGVACNDREPDRIVAQKLQRDSGVSSDDMFAVLLDTYHDHRNAYYFATNPNGVEEDGQVFDGAFSTDLDWDGVWEVKTTKDASGWSAEFKIPLWNLRFAAIDEQTWGVNFTRVIKRKTETVNWASWSRNNGGFLRISRAGDLSGFAGLEPKFNLQVKPYALGKTFRNQLLANAVGEEELEVGADVKYGLTSNLTLDLTFNTDFAQVEADIDQINFTRFPLFFPEKREFFLESASTFTFGERGFFGPPPLLLVFSRRIGIQGVNNVLPITAGGRVTGKVGNFNVGAIDMLTSEQDSIPRTHFSVLRVSRDIFQRSRIGLIFTNRADIGLQQNRSYGADANVWLSNVLEFQTFFAQTKTSNTGNTERAWKGAFDFTKDHWGWLVSHLFVDRFFEPGIGFVQRRDIRRTTATFRVSPQPNGEVLRRTDIRQNFIHILNKEGRLQDWNYGLVFNNFFSSGDQLDLSYNRVFTRLDVPFDFLQDVRIPVGDYFSNQFNAQLNTSSKRPFLISANIFHGDFFTGDRFNWGGSLGFAPNRHLYIEGRYQRNEVSLPQGEVNTNLFVLKFDLAFSTRMFLNSLVQYNSQTNDFSTNIRFNFIHTPGSDLFIVFNENRGRPGEVLRDGLPARDRELTVKFTRFLKI